MNHRDLTLLRHAHAAPAGTGMSDFDRPLSARGEEQLSDTGRQLRLLPTAPDVLLVSAALRTTQTAALVCDALDIAAEQVDHQRDLYLATSAALLRRIRQTADTVRHVLVVGHNPGISDLIDQLHGDTTAGLPTAGFASFQFEGDWAELERAELVGLWD